MALEDKGAVCSKCGSKNLQLEVEACLECNYVFDYHEWQECKEQGGA